MGSIGCYWGLGGIPHHAPILSYLQVNGADVRGARGSMAKRILGNLVAQSIDVIDLHDKEIGIRDAAGAVSAMLLWSSPTLTTLWLRCSSD